MRTLRILLRTNFLSLVGSFRKKSKTSVVLTALLVVFLSLMIVGTFAGLGGSTAYNMIKYGLDEYAIFTSISVSMIVALMFGVTNSSRDARGNDTDMLVSMPIPKSSIVLSKLLGMYLLDVLCSLMMLVPCMVILCTKGGHSMVMFWRGLGVSLLLPALPLFISLLVGALISFLKKNTKFGQIISTVVFIIVWGAYMFIVTSMNNYNDPSMFNAEDALAKMKAIRPLYWFTEAIYRADLFCILMTLVLTLIPLALAVWIHAHGLTGSNYQMDNSKKARVYETNSLRKTALKMELRRYLSSSNYVMNTLFGTLMMILVTGVFAVKGPQAIASINQVEMNGNPVDVPALMAGPVGAALAMAVFVFIAAMTITTPPSVSIEGKRIWISKTLPIPTKSILDAKICVSLLIFQPVAVICCIVTGIVLECGFLPCLFLILVTCVYHLFASLMGMVFGLVYARLDWKNEAQVVKSGMAMFLTLVVNVVLAMVGTVVAIIALLVGNDILTYVLFGVLILFFGGLSIGAYAIITHYGVRKYESLNG